MAVAEVLLQEFIGRFRVTRSIHSDQGREFESQLIANFASCCIWIKREQLRITQSQMAWWRELAELWNKYWAHWSMRHKTIGMLTWHMQWWPIKLLNMKVRNVTPISLCWVVRTISYLIWWLAVHPAQMHAHMHMWSGFNRPQSLPLNSSRNN